MIYKMSSSEEYTEGYGKIEDIDCSNLGYGYGSPEYNFCRNINNEMKKIENGYFIKCLYFYSYGNIYEIVHRVLLIDNYGNCTNYSITLFNGCGNNGIKHTNIPSNFNQKNKNYKLSNKLINLIKCLKLLESEQDPRPPAGLNIQNILDICDNIQILAEDNYKKYMENNVLKAQNNILKLANKN